MSDYFFNENTDMPINITDATPERLAKYKLH